MAEGFLEKRQVGVKELFLQVDGAGGDDHTGIVLKAPQQGWHKVGKGFSGAGAGFDQGVLIGGKGLLDAVEHVHLRRAVLKVGLHLGKNAVLREEGFGIGKAELRHLIRIGVGGFEKIQAVQRRCGRGGCFRQAEQQVAEAAAAVGKKTFLLPVVGHSHFVQHEGVELFGIVHQLEKDLRADNGVVQSAVMVRVWNVQMGGDGNELVAGQRWQKELGHVVGVEPVVWQRTAKLEFHSALIEEVIVCQQPVAVDDLKKLVFNLGPRWRIGHHLVADAGHDGDVFWNGFFWTNQALPGANDGAVFNNRQPNLDDFGIVAEPRRFNINGDKIGVFFHHNAQLFKYASCSAVSWSM